MIPEVEVHRQEGKIRCHIAPAQPFVEFDAVDDRDLAIEVDVVGVQIAVSIADAVCIESSFKGRSPLLEERGDELLDGGVVMNAYGLAAKGKSLEEIISPYRFQSLWAGSGRDLVAALGIAVKVSEDRGDARDLGATDLLAG
jgi:hypothetical protein